METSSLASRFRTLRVILGFSQGEMARAIEKTSSFIALVESGGSNISEGTIAAVCEAWHVNPEWLRSGEGSIFEPGFEIEPPDRAGIPSRIRMLRKEQKLSQAVFAKEIGCSRSLLSAVEQGAAKPSNDLLRRIASHFSVSYRWLLSGTGSMTDESAENAAGMETIYQFLSEDPNAKAVVLEAIQTYTVSRDPAIWARMKESIHQ